MPWSAPKLCSWPGCSRLTDRRHCADHRREFERQRGSAASRGYDKRWQKLRRSILSGEPLCRECQKKGRTTLATEVDHIVPKAQGGSDRRANLQPLCRDCHQAKNHADVAAAQSRKSSSK